MPTIKGTSSISSSEARDKQLKSTKFPKSFYSDRDVCFSKINIPVFLYWIDQRVTQLLGFEDEIVASTVKNLFFPTCNDLQQQQQGATVHVDPRIIQLDLSGFLGEDTATFCQELWDMIVDAQRHPHGIPQKLIEAKKQELANKVKNLSSNTYIATHDKIRSSASYNQRDTIDNTNSNRTTATKRTNTTTTTTTVANTSSNTVTSDVPSQRHAQNQPTAHVNHLNPSMTNVIPDQERKEEGGGRDGAYSDFRRNDKVSRPKRTHPEENGHDSQYQKDGVVGGDEDGKRSKIDNVSHHRKPLSYYPIEQQQQYPSSGPPVHPYRYHENKYARNNDEYYYNYYYNHPHQTSYDRTSSNPSYNYERPPYYPNDTYDRGYMEMTRYYNDTMHDQRAYDIEPAAHGSCMYDSYGRSTHRPHGGPPIMDSHNGSRSSNGDRMKNGSSRDGHYHDFNHYHNNSMPSDRKNEDIESGPKGQGNRSAESYHHHHSQQRQQQQRHDSPPRPPSNRPLSVNEKDHHHHQQQQLQRRHRSPSTSSSRSSYSQSTSSSSTSSSSSSSCSEIKDDFNSKSSASSSSCSEIKDDFNSKSSASSSSS